MTWSWKSRLRACVAVVAVAGMGTLAGPAQGQVVGSSVDAGSSVDVKLPPPAVIAPVPPQAEARDLYVPRIALQEPDNTPGDRDIADQALRIPGEGAGRAEDFRRLETRIRSLESRFGDDFEGEFDPFEDTEEGDDDDTPGVGRGPYRSLFREIDRHFTELDEADQEFGDALRETIKDGTSGSTMKIFGRIHLDYWTYPDTSPGVNDLEFGAGSPFDPQDRFIFRRARIGFGGDLKDNMFYKFELEAPNPNDLEYRDMYLGFRNLGALGSLVFGNQKRPFGLDHLNSSRYNVFLERPFVIEGFNEDARRLGIQVLNVSDDLRWNWRYGVYNLEKTQDDEGYTGDSYQAQVAGRLANTYWYDNRSGGRGYGHWAIAAAIADPNQDGPTYSNEARFRTRPEARTQSRWLNTGRIPGTDAFSILAAEKVLNVGPLQMVGEIQGLWTDRSALNGTAFDDTFFWGGYGYVSYFLTGEHIPWSRESGTIGRVKPFENFFIVRDCNGQKHRGWGAWNIAARYSYADFNDEDIFGGIGSNFTLAVNWHWNANAKLQFNYVHGTIEDSGAGNPGAAQGMAPTVDGDYDILGLRWAIDF